ncbi:Lrp/AsnC ligand binding domain-containing protein [Pseudaestuariivita rosea]|uniref:Lrp/AsnC ligand binding domain-containing protein n=1 Tax=Pseudaestuariivita rosea TaxID=2763263 RepID=UPI001ABAD40A|nr:Lrp/AsnC ligand binding domain-containing protein [Pseudaestuariivita rosea]
MICAFIFFRCKPGSAYRVASELAEKELHSELYSISGDFDLLMKVYVPKDEDLGLFVNEKILGSEDIVRSQTVMAFKAFH